MQSKRRPRRPALLQARLRRAVVSLLGAAYFAVAAGAHGRPLPDDTTWRSDVDHAEVDTLLADLFADSACARCDVNGDGTLSAADVVALFAVLAPATATTTPTATAVSPTRTLPPTNTAPASTSTPILSVTTAAPPSPSVTPTPPLQSVARQWDEEILGAIRIDLPRPPIHARNLFHCSMAMWDAWATFDTTAAGYLTTEKHTSINPDADRAEAISYAAYRVLAERYKISPNATTSLASFKTRMAALGYDPSVTTTAGDTPAAIGNRIAQAIIDYGLSDGSDESNNYGDPTYIPVNPHSSWLFRVPR